MAFNFLDRTGTLWLINKIKTALGKKVDTVAGKGLSTNDLTDALKKKYDDAASDVTSLKEQDLVNKINSISVNGTAAEISANKNVDLTIPTTANIKTQIEAYGYQTAANVDTIVSGKGYQTASQVDETISAKGYQTADQVDAIVTGKGYQTSTQVEAAITGKGYQTSDDVQAAISGAIGEVTSINISVVSALPATGVNGTIYLVAHTHGEKDVYDEYIWVTSQNKFEKIGNTDIDLSSYAKTADFVAITEDELTTLWNT